MKVLVVEDEKRMLDLLCRGLKEEGHSVACATDGEDGLAIATAHDFDVVILDIMLPKLNGYEVAKRLRGIHSHLPLLMLTARDTVEDIVEGLDVGADDYVTKPFSFNELLARLASVQRRTRMRANSCLQVGELHLDLATHKVLRNDVRLDLTRTEFCLLEQLMRCAGSVVSRNALIESVWGGERHVVDNHLDAFMHLLRNKVELPGRPKLIHTARGAGYVLRAPAQS
jgi:DNA-binding response OmpR family regulator